MPSYVYSKLQVGDSNSFEKTITAADVLLFSAVSGDCNPMHVSDEFAKKSQFGQRIAHGALVSGLISTALTNAFPTSIYISECEVSGTCISWRYHPGSCYLQGEAGKRTCTHADRLL